MQANASREYHWKPGTSGNPKGRPRGAVNKKTLIAQALMEEGAAIVRVVIDAALAGDVQAAALVLNRLQPTLKPRAERVEFELDTNKSLTGQAKQVLQAISKGEIDPDTGKAMIDSISTFARLKEVDELAERLENVEQRLNVERVLNFNLERIQNG